MASDDLQSISEALKSSEKKANFLHLSKLLVGGGTWAMKHLFDKLCPPAQLRHILEQHKSLFTSRSNPQGFSRVDLNYLYPDHGESTSANFDLLFLYKLLTPKSLECFGLEAIDDKEVMKDLKTLRDLRNGIYAHTVTLEIEEEEFLELHDEISAILKRLAHVIGGSAMVTEMNAAIKKLLKEELDTSSEGLIFTETRFKEMQAYVKDGFAATIASSEEIISKIDPLKRDLETLKQSVDNMRLNVTAQNGGGIGTPTRAVIQKKRKEKVMKELISGGEESLKSCEYLPSANDNQYVALMVRDVHKEKQRDESDSDQSEDEDAGHLPIDILNPQADADARHEDVKVQRLCAAAEGEVRGAEGGDRHKSNKIPPGARPKQPGYKKSCGNAARTEDTQSVPEWCYNYLQDRESVCKQELKEIEKMKTIAGSELRKKINGAHNQMNGDDLQEKVQVSDPKHGAQPVVQPDEVTSGLGTQRSAGEQNCVGGRLNLSYEDYERMTNNFDNDHHIDTGGQGEVFYGKKDVKLQTPIFVASLGCL